MTFCLVRYGNVHPSWSLACRHISTTIDDLEKGLSNYLLTKNPPSLVHDSFVSRVSVDVELHVMRLSVDAIYASCGETNDNCVVEDIIRMGGANVTLICTWQLQSG